MDQTHKCYLPRDAESVDAICLGFAFVHRKCPNLTLPPFTPFQRNWSMRCFDCDETVVFRFRWPSFAQLVREGKRLHEREWHNWDLELTALGSPTTNATSQVET